MSSYVPMRPTKYCAACHRVIDAEAVVCTSCGVMQPYFSAGSEKRILPALLLCFFLGIFGAHRFYAGKTGPPCCNCSRSAGSASGRSST